MKRRFYRALLYLYPAAFREEYGTEMELAFIDQHQPWTHAVADVVRVVPREHLNVIAQDLRHAFRTLLGNPGFAVVAISTLALGIAANTAIFGLWYNVTRAPLPLVKQPEQLVILTDPTAIGQWFGDQGGNRSWLSYPEYQLMRDQLQGVSGVMASQSSLDDWRVEIGAGQWETVRGHFVSGNFFDFLRVAPALGRSFTENDEEAYAVIGYNYWQRKFGGNPNAIGQTIRFRSASVTITGVMPQGFVGEVAAQQPDVWMPIRMQPVIEPARNLLVDGPTQDGVPRKMMWLHVFARRQPGVSFSSVEAQAKALFDAEMLRSYGKPVDQHLVIHEGAQGISDSRAAFGDSLAAMLAGAAVLLLIACANLANLQLARGMSRRAEFAIRVAQGASRGHLVRQLVTESVVLASAGAMAGVSLAYFLHAALVSGMAEGDGDFVLAFGLDWTTVLYTVGITLLAVVVSGLVPALRVTKMDAHVGLRDQTRTATASGSRLRFGRALVALQLALALPLLVAAGTLVRTVQNALHHDLGYRREGLIVARVFGQEAGYVGPREDALRERLRQEMERIPGMQLVTYSENALFTGGRSFHSLKVEGYEPTGEDDRGSRLEIVATNYFDTIGVRPLAGRVFTAADTVNAPRVIVIDEAFARLFFAGRNPLGKRVTAGRGNEQQTFQVVGIVPSMAVQNDTVKAPVSHYYVPAEQRGKDGLGLNFILRTGADEAAAQMAVQRIVRSVDASLPVETKTIDEAMRRFTAMERTLGTLAVAFGATALLLAAIGLYGVLAYGVARRRSEIGLRIALGAERGRVVGLILRESAVVVLGGLILGTWPAWAVSQLLRAQFADFSPQDSNALALAGAVLTVVGFAAAYLPARRASRLDPMIALRSE